MFVCDFFGGVNHLLGVLAIAICPVTNRLQLLHEDTATQITCCQRFYALINLPHINNFLCHLQSGTASPFKFHTLSTIHGEGQTFSIMTTLTQALYIKQLICIQLILLSL